MPKFKLFHKKKNEIDEVAAEEHPDSKRNMNDTFASFPELLAIKPREKYEFYSDYFLDDTYASTILSYNHHQGAIDGFPAFWGVERTPGELPLGVTTINIDQVKRMSEAWVQEHRTKAETITNASAGADGEGGSMMDRQKVSRSKEDIYDISNDLMDGASYLACSDKLLVKAPSLEMLDESVDQIDRMNKDRFKTITTEALAGQQRQDLSSIFKPIEKKPGKPFYYTSTQFAGSYWLVTHGFEDEHGEYVGYMTGDVNNSAVLLDVDNYGEHGVVVATEQIDNMRGGISVSDEWGVKLGEAAMLDGHRVVHIVMNNSKLTEIGPAFPRSTTTIDMNHGDVNMFEMFGKQEDELAVFAAQMRKLVLMAEQSYHPNESEKAIIEGQLESVATKFYINNHMWSEDAKNHRDELRVVGQPHEQVPTLENFTLYLKQEFRNAQANHETQERIHALDVLATMFENLRKTNGDLFDTHTNPAIDRVQSGRRVIYDFSGLMRRGPGIAMAQLVNVIAMAIGHIGKDDVLIFHGTQNISKDVHSYLDQQISMFRHEGGRVAFCYDSVEAMVDDAAFCEFQKADYTVLGNMTDDVFNKYQEALSQQTPTELTALITGRDSQRCYIRRGVDNVIFIQDLKLFPDDYQNELKAMTGAV